MADNGIRLTREELYRLMWERPASRLAKEFGISDVALGKLCRRMGIPKPPPGYWARVEAGQRPQVPPLPAGEKATPSVAHIPVRRQPELTALGDLEVLRGLASNGLNGERITISDTLADPHPLIAAMLNCLRMRAAGDGDDTSGDDSLPDIEASDATIDRALRIMDILMKTLEARGYRVKVSRDYWGKATRVYCADADAEVQISLTERHSERQRDLTPAEKKKPPYLIDNRFITVPSGKLTFKVRGRGVETKWWTDKKHDPLENRLDEVLLGLIVRLEGLRLEDLAEKEAERRRAEERRRQEEEQARREKLHRDAAAWRQSEDIRAYLRAYEEKLCSRQDGIVLGGEEDEWLRWARRYADSLDPLNDKEE